MQIGSLLTMAGVCLALLTQKHLRMLARTLQTRTSPFGSLSDCHIRCTRGAALLQLSDVTADVPVESDDSWAPLESMQTEWEFDVDVVRHKGKLTSHVCWLLGQLHCPLPLWTAASAWHAPSMGVGMPEPWSCGFQDQGAASGERSQLQWWALC